jgi:hypothetical protein
MLKITGLDELQRKLDDLARNAQNLSGKQDVPITELLTPSFLSRCSRFQSAKELFEASGFKLESADDFAAIPHAEWDGFIHANTSFASWEIMLGEAGGEWTARQLGLG